MAVFIKSRRCDRIQNWKYKSPKTNLKGDSGASSGDATKVSEKAVYGMFGSTLRLKLSKLLETIGLFCPHSMNLTNFECIITLPASNDVLIAQANQAAAEYSLENLQLEYETIMNKDVSYEITTNFSIGKSIPYEHVTMFHKLSWAKASTLLNINVNVPRKCMKAIVLLFKDDSTDSEDFAYPNLKTVKISIEGKPNQVYPRDLTRNRFYEEASRLFSNKMMKYDKNLTVFDFCQDGFSLVIDLRSHEDNDSYGSGRRIINTQIGVLLELTKSGTTAKFNFKICVLRL